MRTKVLFLYVYKNKSYFEFNGKRFENEEKVWKYINRYYLPRNRDVMILPRRYDFDHELSEDFIIQ
jgi:hypothetical protein